jgi:glycosyltransferase involved in cell wall biosynthesis
MKFSILITNYNKKKYIQKCIKSCVNQKYKKFEIIFFDNYSRDGSQLVLKKFEKNCYIKKKRRISKSSAMNQIDLIKEGVKFCNGDIICLLDSDDYFLSNKLNIVKKNFETNKNIQIVFDVPLIKMQKQLQKMKLGNFLKKNTWPTIINTSGISIKKIFLQKCIKAKIFDRYSLLEVDFRINAICRILNVGYKIIEENLTVYNADASGIMSKLTKYTNVWWKKRLQAHSFMIDKFEQRGKQYNSFLDYNVTRLINFFFTFFGKKSL